MQNLRFLVCESCYDAPQQSGQRTILLSADPIPVMNARPEFYVPDSNPLSALGANPVQAIWQYGSRIGTMTEGGGVAAAFDGNANKPSWMSAVITTSPSSYRSYVGINWSGYPATTASTLNSPVLTHTVTEYTITAPNDSTFGSTGYLVQGSPVDASWGSWTTIASGNPAGTVGEVITGTAAGARYQFHRVAFFSNGGPTIAVAQVEFNVSDGSSNT